MEPKKIDKNLEKKILKCFNEIHGKLQRIETKLLQEAAFSVNVCLESLRDAERELSQNMAAVRDIIKIGDDIIKQKKLNAGQNIDLVMQRMINAGKLPHSLQPIEKSSLGSNRRYDLYFIVTNCVYIFESLLLEMTLNLLTSLLIWSPISR